MAIKEISSSLPNEEDFFHPPVANDVNLFKPLDIKPIIRGNWASSSTRVRMNNMSNHYEKNGCFAIGLAIQFFELQ
jgi:hypothetical protein